MEFQSPCPVAALPPYNSLEIHPHPIPITMKSFIALAVCLFAATVSAGTVQDKMMVVAKAGAAAIAPKGVVSFTRCGKPGNFIHKNSVSYLSSN
jgi:hypothetical protein